MTTEEILSKIIDGSPIPTFVINKNHQVLHWNTAIESLCGIKQHDIVGTKEQWRAFYTEKRPVMADLIVDGASADEVEVYYEGRCRKSNLIEGAYEAEDFFPTLGEYGRGLHFTASPLRDEKGAIIGAIETLQDITERQNAEGALHLSEERFRDLFESAIDVIWVHDLEGNIQIANNAAAKLTGYSIEALLKANISLLFTPDGLKLSKKIQTQLVNNQPVSMPYQLKLYRKDGTELIVEITTRLIKQNNQPFSFQSIARDVTQEQKKQESMQYFLSEVLVAQEEERKRIARDLHDDTAQSLLLLIHKLDAIISNRATPLQKRVKEELTKLNSLAIETHDGLRRYVQELRPAILDDLGLEAALEWISDNLGLENGIDVDVQVNISKRNLTKETQLILFRIAQEALTNIKKHANASKAAIRLDSSTSKTRMIISDNGKGFETPARLSDFSSSGKLGLIGIKERSQLLNGTIDIKSEIGKGTTLIIELPYREDLKF